MKKETHHEKMDFDCSQFTDFIDIELSG